MIEHPRQLTLTVEDGRAPDVGTFLASVKKNGTIGTRYRVLRARRVNTRDGARRYALSIIRVSADDVPEMTPLFRFHWFPRTKKARR